MLCVSVNVAVACCELLGEGVLVAVSVIALVLNCCCHTKERHHSYMAKFLRDVCGVQHCGVMK